MWSYVQYNQIGKQVEEKYSRTQRGPPAPWNGTIRKRPLNPDVEASEGAGSRSTQVRSELDQVNQIQQHIDDTGTAKEFQEQDEFKVTLDGEQDPLEPKNWPLVARGKNMAILTLLIFVQGWAGTAGSVANAQISRALGVSKVAEDLTTALYLVGVGSGCVFVGPLSETVGRNPVYLISTFCYLFFVLGCALASTFGGQMVCRFFTGFFASATLGINGASVKDQFRPVKRSFVFPVIAWANVASRVIAPVAGGWIVSSPHLDWRWCYWITFIISVFAFVVAVLFLPETYVPILLEWKAQHLRRVTGDNRYISQHAESASFLKRISERLPLGVTFFRTEPIVVVFGAYLVLIYILLFTFQSGFDYTFKQTYRLSTELTGSCFGAIAAGSTAFTFAAPALYSWARHKTEFVQGASIKPEFRLWPAVATAPLLPISLFWLGWTNYPSISIWSGLAACFVLGIAMTAIYVSSYEYIIDSYGKHAAVALSAITMARYLISSGMVMAARPSESRPVSSV